MSLKRVWNKTWEYLKRDTWDSWIVSMVLLVLIIKFVFFPVLGLITNTSLPLVIVESCSMYHESSYGEWWQKNAAWYNNININESTFSSFSLKNGLNKGDIIFVIGKKNYQIGDIIIYPSITAHPIIHRIVTENPITTKGDHNAQQYSFDTSVPQNGIIGKAAFKIPLLGWAKLIFFEPFRSESERGFC